MQGIPAAVMTFSCLVAFTAAIKRPSEPLGAGTLRQRHSNRYQAPHFGHRQIG